MTWKVKSTMCVALGQKGNEIFPREISEFFCQDGLTSFSAWRLQLRSLWLMDVMLFTWIAAVKNRSKSLNNREIFDDSYDRIEAFLIISYCYRLGGQLHILKLLEVVKLVKESKRLNLLSQNEKWKITFLHYKSWARANRKILSMPLLIPNTSFRYLK